MRARGQHGSATQSIKAFLAKKGSTGATLREIYGAVRADLGERVLDSSIRSILYKRLVTAKTAYRPAFERLGAGSSVRYRTVSKSRIG